MAFKSIPTRLTTAQILEKFTSPMVDIYVGPENKHFNIPKDMLCYYSTYFERCFNGAFKEAHELKLVLPEDNVEHFQHLLDYVFINGGESFKAKGDIKQQMEYYMAFLEYANKYDLVGAVQIISPGLKEILKGYFNFSTGKARLAPEHIEIIFRVLPDGHELRELVAVLALKFGLVSGKFAEQEKSVDGFAVEVLKQLRKHKDGRSFSKVVSYYDELDHKF